MDSNPCSLAVQPWIVTALCASEPALRNKLTEEGSMHESPRSSGKMAPPSVKDPRIAPATQPVPYRRLVIHTRPTRENEAQNCLSSAQDYMPSVASWCLNPELSTNTITHNLIKRRQNKGLFIPSLVFRPLLCPTPSSHFLLSRPSKGERSSFAGKLCIGTRLRFTASHFQARPFCGARSPLMELSDNVIMSIYQFSKYSLSQHPLRH